MTLTDFRYLNPGSIPLAPYQGNRTYPEYISSGQDSEFTRAAFLTNDSAVCLDVANPVYGTWFGVAYLAEQHRDEAIRVSELLHCWNDNEIGIFCVGSRE